MSTKYLARTVIEGGRRHRNQWDRRYSHKEERAAERQVSVRLPRLESLDSALYEPRRPVWREFSDKLGPARRWMRRQVGRPWNKVRGELFQRFDSRTTAGRHILFDHLLRSVQTGGSPLSHWWFEVDRQGILREVQRYPRRSNRVRAPLPEPESVLLTWLAGRCIGARGMHLYWFVPTPAGALRQGLPLDDVDAARWRSLPGWFRERWDAFATASERTD
jgi:hypothetical protein